MKHKVLWFHVRNLSFDLLEPALACSFTCELMAAMSGVGYLSREYPLEHPICPRQWKRSTKNFVSLKWDGSRFRTYWWSLQLLSYYIIFVGGTGNLVRKMLKGCLGDLLRHHEISHKRNTEISQHLMEVWEAGVVAWWRPLPECNSCTTWMGRKLEWQAARDHSELLRTL